MGGGVGGKGFVHGSYRRWSFAFGTFSQLCISFVLVLCNFIVYLWKR